VEQPVWDRLLHSLSKGDPGSPGGGSADMLRKVLSRVALAQEPVPRSEISKGSMLIRPTPLAAGSVGKAVEALKREGLLIAQDKVNTAQPGPPIEPLRLSDKWAVIGIHIDQQHGGPDRLSGTICGLDRKQLVDQPVECSVPREGDHRDLRGLAEAIRKLAETLLAQLTSQHKFLGIGVAIGGHVHDGVVQDSVHAGWDGPVRLREALTEVFEEVPQLKKVPVIVENDVNALAIHGYYERSFEGLDVALTAVYRQGVGGALILNGRVYRGAGGMAPEPGHLPVEYPEDQPGWSLPAWRPSTAEGRTFSDECLCSTKERRAYGHVETLAVPARIEAQLAADKPGEKISLEDAATAPQSIPQGENTFVLTPEAVVMRRAGRALGRGLSEMINILNPGQLVLRLPRALATPPPQSSGAEYLAAVEREVDRAYSTGARDARGEHLRLKILPYENHEQMAREVAVAAATTAFNAFLEYTRGFDKRLSARAA